MLKMRVLYEFLPQNFDYLEEFLQPIHYSSLNNDRKSIEIRNKTNKYIQEAKRTWLDLYCNTYITKIQAYDQQYQYEFKQIESQIMKSASTDNALSMIKKIEDSMTDQTNQIKENIYNQMSSFQKKLLQNRQRSSSSSSTTQKTMISTSPKPYLDLISNYFDKFQWNHLSYGKIILFLLYVLYRKNHSLSYFLFSGPSMIRPNQSTTHSREQHQSEITKLHKGIFDKVERCLIAHKMQATHPNLKKYSDQLRNYLNHQYFSPLPYKDQIEAVKYAQITSSIREIIQKNKLIIRETDKGNNFYIGSAAVFEEKAQQFFKDTEAFKELTRNPLKENLNKVWNFLHKLAKDRLILQKHCMKMLPDRKKVKLSHLYFNPKTHKVNVEKKYISFYYFNFSHLLFIHIG